MNNGKLMQLYLWEPSLQQGCEVRSSWSVWSCNSMGTESAMGCVMVHGHLDDVEIPVPAFGAALGKSLRCGWQTLGSTEL